MSSKRPLITASETEGKAFGSWLRRRRNELGVTRDQLAEQVGFSLDLLKKLESGERRPSDQIAHLLADYFHVHTDEREAFVTFARTGRVEESIPSLGGEDASGAAGTPWRRAYGHSTNLPSMLTPLVGREEELAAATELFLRPRMRLLTITGPPGVGKTRLALQLASDLLDHFADGVFMVDLSAVEDPALVLETVAYTLALNDKAYHSLEDALFDFVRSRRLVLFLDNFEQVLDAAPGIVRLMQASPWLKMVVTSREALHVRGEHRYEVPPLKLLAPGQGVEPGLLDDYPSIRLFVERAQAVRPGFTLDSSNVAAVTEICRRVGGLPLSIELIAARIRILTPDQILGHLKKAGDLALLTGGATDLPSRHRSLRGAIAWSYNLLSKGEKEVFRRLGVFAGGLTAESAAAVSVGTGTSSLETLDEVLSLLDKSLLERAEAVVPAPHRDMKTELAEHLSSARFDEPRFSMLEVVRQFAQEQLRQAGEEELARGRHAGFFAKLAERAEPELNGPEQATWLALLGWESGNIRAALEWSSGVDPEATARMMFALRRFWNIRGYFAEGRKWLESVLARGGAVPPTLRARTLYVLSSLVLQRGDQGLSISYLEECQTLARRSGDRDLESLALGQLAYSLLEQGNDRRAKTLFKKRLVLERERGDKDRVCWCLTALGEIARSGAHLARARAYYEEALVLARELENKLSVAHLAANIASVALAEGDSARARLYLSEALALAHELGYDAGIVGCLTGFVGLAVAEGEFEQAAMISGTVERQFEAGTSRPDALDVRAYEHYVLAARQQLDEDRWRSAWASGHAMTAEQAISIAMKL